MKDRLLCLHVGRHILTWLWSVLTPSSLPPCLLVILSLPLHLAVYHHAEPVPSLLDGAGAKILALTFNLALKIRTAQAVSREG